jgi:hypothetical protein
MKKDQPIECAFDIEKYKVAIPILMDFMEFSHERQLNLRYYDKEKYADFIFEYLKHLSIRCEIENIILG